VVTRTITTRLETNPKDQAGAMGSPRGRSGAPAVKRELMEELYEKREPEPMEGVGVKLEFMEGLH
jgi:hypothetical protein